MATVTDRHINITYPFVDSDKGWFLGMNKDARNAIRSKVAYLLTTQKGTRYRLPDFGVNLRQYIGEQNDAILNAAIQSEINNAVDRFLPNVNIKKFAIDGATNPHQINITIQFSYNDGFVSELDTISFTVI